MFPSSMIIFPTSFSNSKRRIPDGKGICRSNLEFLVSRSPYNLYGRSKKWHQRKQGNENPETTHAYSPSSRRNLERGKHFSFRGMALALIEGIKASQE